MAKHYADFGHVFIVEGRRSSNPNVGTLFAYMYKHHIDPKSKAIVLDLDKNDQMVEDYGNPIAKVNWHGDGGVVKKLDTAKYDALSSSIKLSIESTFRGYLIEHSK